MENEIELSFVPLLILHHTYPSMHHLSRVLKGRFPSNVTLTFFEKVVVAKCRMRASLVPLMKYHYHIIGMTPQSHMAFDTDGHI